MMLFSELYFFTARRSADHSFVNRQYTLSGLFYTRTLVRRKHTAHTQRTFFFQRALFSNAA